mgnify:CR=1 FL=1
MTDAPEGLEDVVGTDAPAPRKFCRPCALLQVLKMRKCLISCPTEGWYHTNTCVITTPVAGPLRVLRSPIAFSSFLLWCWRMFFHSICWSVSFKVIGGAENTFLFLPCFSVLLSVCLLGEGLCVRNWGKRHSIHCQSVKSGCLTPPCLAADEHTEDTRALFHGVIPPGQSVDVWVDPSSVVSMQCSFGVEGEEWSGGCIIFGTRHDTPEMVVTNLVSVLAPLFPVTSPVGFSLLEGRCAKKSHIHSPLSTPGSGVGATFFPSQDSRMELSVFLDHQHDAPDREDLFHKVSLYTTDWIFNHVRVASPPCGLRQVLNKQQWS